MIEGIVLLGEMALIKVEAATRQVPARNRQTGEVIEGEFTTEYIVPTTGYIMGLGADVKESKLTVGDKVLLPSGNMVKVTNPQFVSGEVEDEEDCDNFVMTHYKNIAVIYK